jgi:aminopeptidase YwaD
MNMSAQACSPQAMPHGMAQAGAIKDHLLVIEDIGPRPDGSDPDQRLVTYIETTLNSFGLAVVKHSIDVSVIVDPQTRLEVLGPTAQPVAAIANLRSGLAPSGSVEGPLAFCGKAFTSDLEGLDLTGKIALAYEAVPYESHVPGEVGWHLEKFHRLRDHGASAVVFCTQRLDNEITTWGLFGLDKRVDDFPSVAIGYRDFERLREASAAGIVVVRLTHHGKMETRAADVLSAVLPGSDLAGEEIVFIGGHHETVPTCRGVNDNGSGIAIMLEAARVLRVLPRRRSIRLLVTCGEESGCWGSESFMKSPHVTGRRVRAVLNVDQVAGTDVRLIGHGTAWLNRVLIEVANAAGFVLGTTHEEPKIAAILGDAEPWWEAGHPSAMLSGWWSDPVYHTSADTLRLVNPNYLKIWCDILLTATHRLANGDLPDGN